MNQKLVPSEVKIRQKLVESGQKLSFLGAFLELSATEMTVTTLAFFLIHLISQA